jgi:DUF4097 and DUF4098 domain-containing protein YvlB
MKTALLLTSLLLTQVALAERVTRETQAEPDGEVQIVNVSGNVRVMGWDQAKVQLVADLGSGVEELEFERDDDVTRIRVKFPRDEHARNEQSSDLTVHVPRESTLMIKTVSASQTVENVIGEQRLQSVSGEILTSTASEDLEAKTVSGEIRVKGNGKPTSTRITSVSGAITLDEVSGEFELSTVNGVIRLQAGQIEEGRFNTTNGEIRIDGTSTDDARIEAESINGAIHMTLRGKPNAAFDIETFNGGIRNCFGPKPRRTSEYAPGTVLRFSEGEGEGQVRIKTLNGSIELCNK